MMNKLSIFVLVFSVMFSMTSCDVLEQILVAQAQQQQQQQQQQEQQQQQQKNQNQKPRDGKVLRTSDKYNGNNELYKELNLNNSQIKKYEAIKVKYKAEARQLAKTKKSDRRALKEGLKLINTKQNNDLKKIFSSAQFKRYTELMDQGYDKRSN